MEKHKLASISLTVWDRTISVKFSTLKVSRVYGRLFTKITSPPLLAAILNFCVKRKNTYLGNGARRKYLACRVYEVYWRLFAKIAFPPLLAAILNFCVKRKSAFISETVRDRAISTKVWTRRVSAECTGDFSQKSLSRHFWRPSWISA